MVKKQSNEIKDTMQEDEKLVFEEEFSGEPTTADEHNKVYIQDLETVDKMNKAIKETPEYKLGKKVFGGDTGIDADYYDENSEKYISEPVEVLYKKDLLKLMDKVDDLEQMIFNQGAKNRDNYKLINDRISEAFDIIKILERK